MPKDPIEPALHDAAGKKRPAVSRRTFLRGAGGIATATAALATIGVEPLLGKESMTI
jgi:hypothetical protein